MACSYKHFNLPLEEFSLNLPDHGFRILDLSIFASDEFCGLTFELTGPLRYVAKGPE
jgi:hypothetical protein